VGSGATSGTVVGATVPSATRLIPTNCASGMAGRTELGSLLPGANAIGMTGCAIEFGSSNDTGKLRLRQADGHGAAMYRPALGTLETSFGASGYQSTSVTAGADWYVDAVRLPDGGGYLLLGQSDTADDDIFVEKRDNDWNLVGGYGVGGRRTIDHGNPDTAGRIAIDSAGRAVVFAKSDTWDLVVHRLTTSGSLDGTFGTGGTADHGFTSQSPASGAVLADGRIAVAGSDDNGPDRDAAIILLTSSGAPDSVSPMIDVSGHDDVVDVVAVPGGGAYLLVSNQSNGGDSVVVRFKADATVETTWATNGVTAQAWATCCANVPSDLELDSAGRLLVTGYVNGGANEFWLVRYTAAGALDGGFGTGGRVMRDPGSVWNHHNHVLAADDGSVVVGVGQYYDTSDPSDDGGRLYRYDSAGVLDPTFTDGGGTGRVHLHPTPADMSSAYLPVQGPDGTIFGLGLAKQGADVQTLAAKLEARSIPQYSTGSDQDFDSTVNAAFGACLVSLTSGTATGPWSAYGSAGCEADDVANWSPIAATSAGATHQVATANAGVDTALATLRFGFHTVGSTPPGRWVAPVVIEVTAP
jgi:uncharacterized delta-60 repeat protein